MVVAPPVECLSRDLKNGGAPGLCRGGEKNNRPGGTFLAALTPIGVSVSTAGVDLRFTEALEDVMSRESISIIVTVVVIALMFAWVPLVNFVCPPGWSSKEKAQDEEKDRKRQPAQPMRPPEMVPSSRLSSKRLRDQSRDLCAAISARGERGTARSQSTASRISPASQMTDC